MQTHLSQRRTWRFYTPLGHTWRFIFFGRSRRCGSFEKSCDEIAQHDGLAFLAIRSNDRRKSRERAPLANAGEFNRRYLTCQTSAILYADRGDRQKSQSLHRAHLVIFAVRGDRKVCRRLKLSKRSISDFHGSTIGPIAPCKETLFTLASQVDPSHLNTCGFRIQTAD